MRPFLHQTTSMKHFTILALLAFLCGSAIGQGAASYVSNNNQLTYLGYGDAYCFGPNFAGLEPVQVEIYSVHDLHSPVLMFAVHPGVAKVVPRPTDGLEIVDPVIRPGNLNDDINALCFYDCFPARTPVQTPTGPAAIQDLKPGDLVLTGDGELTRVSAVRKAVSLSLVSVHLVGNRVLRCTAGHRILTANRGWISAGELRAKDQIHCGDGQTAVVEAVVRPQLSRPIAVYDVELIDGNSLCVGTDGLIAAARTAPSRPEPSQLATSAIAIERITPSPPANHTALLSGLLLQ